MRYLIEFSYDGTNYYGYQKQPGKITIQEKIEEALKKINSNKYTPITTTGRTDRGVHALKQYGHVDMTVKITEKGLKRALNSNLPDDIYVKNVKIVDDNFHARYNVKSKEYMYILNMGEYNPLERNLVYQCNHKLNLEKMKEGIQFFLGEHDFRAFVTNNKGKYNCIREITRVSIKQDNDKIYFFFKGTGFLKYQVRNMVGILIRVGEEKIEPSEIKIILDSKDRNKTGKTAPSHGLYLINVEY